MKTIACCVLVVTAALPADAGVELSVRPGAVRVHADGVSLADVLDAVAQRTGMQIVYDGQRPQQVVDTTVTGPNVAAAVFQILEGQGLNYALALDATGTRVTTLILAGPAAPGARRPAPAAAPEPEPDVDPFADQAPPPEAPPGALDDGSDEEGAETPLQPEDPGGFPSSPFTPRPDGPALPQLPGGSGGGPGAAPVNREELLRQRLEQLRQQREQSPQQRPDPQ